MENIKIDLWSIFSFKINLKQTKQSYLVQFIEHKKLVTKFSSPYFVRYMVQKQDNLENQIVGGSWISHLTTPVCVWRPWTIEMAMVLLVFHVVRRKGDKNYPR